MRFSGKQYYPNKPRISKLLSRKHELYLDFGNSDRKNSECDLRITWHCTFVELWVGNLNVFRKQWSGKGLLSPRAVSIWNQCYRVQPLLTDKGNPYTLFIETFHSPIRGGGGARWKVVYLNLSTSVLSSIDLLNLYINIYIFLNAVIILQVLFNIIQVLMYPW